LNDLNAIYPGQLYLTAHSLGNVVAGEALRLASSQVVNTYVALQGAVAAHAYDPTAAIHDLGSFDAGTPNCYAHYWTNGAPCYFNASAGAGADVNFYNTNDWALNNAWLLFENNKPALNPSYGYTPPNIYYKQLLTRTDLFFTGDRYELFSNLIQARSYALGMQAGVNGVFDGNQVELDASPYNFQSQHIYHSGEFRSDYAQRWQFWQQVLIKTKLKSP
jgi:hypothetical protein